MGQKEMTVNILPTRTWNRLGMNESQIQIEWPEKSVLIKPEHLAAGVTWEKEISGKEWDEIQTGMGREYDAMAAECGTAGANRTDTVNGTVAAEENAGANANINAGAGSIYRLTAEAAAVLQNENVSEIKTRENTSEETTQNTEWTVLCVDYKNGSYQNRLYLDAKENSRLNVLIVFRSEADAQGTSSFQVKVHAEKNAKVQLQEVQLLGAGYTCLSDIGASCGENATFELLKLELGAGKVYAGCLTELEGKKSAFDAKIGYYTSVNQKLDMNYTVRHRGKKTESLMEVSGVLQDGSSKLFRGTIDFVPGCAGAKGTEREDVLLLGDDIVNQTIPLILCAEEDVEGNHGASMGDLDDATLFYLCSRGLSREEAERMVARARIDALNELVADEAVQKQVQEFMNQKR